MTTQLPRLLTTAELSEYLGVPIRTLEGWRDPNNPQGPPYIHVGARVRYPEDRLADWIAALSRAEEGR
ncbi:MAG: helix-turn-helix transcriptional regulator [Microbacteriaceae bacterium]